jgi:hypothetical protein
LASGNGWDATAPLQNPSQSNKKQTDPKHKTSDTSLALASDSGYCSVMPVALPLNEMTVPEKLRLMEALWEDLSRNADGLESPEWHRDVLEERERRIAGGEAHFSEREQAKADIRKRVS